MPGRGKPSQREGQRAENAKGGTEGLRKGALESRGGSRGVPAESAGAKRSWSAQLVRTGSSLSPAVPEAAGAPLSCAAQAPAGRRREGKVRGSEAAAGSRTYVASACWRRRRGAGVLGNLRRSHCAARAGQDRPGPGWTARGTHRGRSMPESGVPRWSLLSVPRRSQWRAVPSHAPGCLAPEGGRRGGRERGVGGAWAPGSPAEALLETAGGGRAHALGDGASESKLGAAQEDFLGKF